MPRKRRHQPSVPQDRSKRLLYLLGALVVFVILVTTIVHGLKNTLFFGEKDRINIVFYGNKTTYYSLGIHTEGDYTIPFSSDVKMPIPGGYGDYRVGALGKLVSLEKKPVLIQNTFSLATYSFVDYYFYKKSDEIYYGTNDDVLLPTPGFIWSSASNASFLDKIYLIFYFLNKSPSDFHQVPVHTDKNANGDITFAAGEFEKLITGYLFQQTYRNERKSVQIWYLDNYENADRVAEMLQGNGIRVDDISQTNTPIKGCVVTENSATPSFTSKAIMTRFNCTWKKGKTDIYDILFQLGEREKEWEVK